MAGVLQHLRSSTLNKRPNPASMVDGQVAINYASGSPGMFFKDSNGSLVKVGPVHVGATAPNVSPASGGTAGNSLGEQWLDTSGGTYVFKIWDGAAWRSEAGEFVNSTGDTMTGSLTMGPSADLIFEGSVDDGFETTLTVVNPTADRTITLPNVSGTVVTTGDSETVTSTMIRNDTIVNADINSSAAIAGTKISPDFGSQTVQTTGIFSAAGGSAAAPSIAFTGDTNTGIYSPGADQVAISTSGVGRLLVDSSGNLIQYSETTLERQHRQQAASAYTATNIKSVIDGATGYLTFETGSNWTNGNAVERLRITSAGLVGVGTSSPLSKFDIASTYAYGTSAQDVIRLTPNFSGGSSSSASSAGSILWGYNDGTNLGRINVVANQPSTTLATSMQFWIHNGSSFSQAATLTPTGLGVGTTSPQSSLHVSASASAAYIGQILENTSSSGYVQQIFNIGANGANGQATVGYAPGLFFAIGPTANDTTTPIVFRNNNATERARIDSSGNVGIGTSSPGSKLHVAGGATVVSIGSNDAGDTGAAIFYGTGTKYNWKIGAQQNVDNAFEITPSTAAGGTTFTTPSLVINSAGNVGIGTTSPTALLQVGVGNTSPAVAKAVFNTADSTDAGILISNWTGIGTTNGPRLAFDNSGIGGWNIGGGNGTNTFVIRDTFSSSDRLTIDSSGRLLVGTSSASGTNTLFESSSATADAANVALVKRNSGTADQAGQQLHFYNFGPAGTGRAADTEVGSMRFYGSQPTSGAAQEMARITCAADLLQTGTNTSGRLTFSTTKDGQASPTEACRINSSQQVLIGTQSISIGTQLEVVGTSGSAAAFIASSQGDYSVFCHNKATSGDNSFISFGTEASFTTRGSVTYNRTGGVVAYNTTSDYRAKTILGDLENYGSTIDAFKVYRGVMNGATVERPMLIAHEAQEVAPYCVTGVKDAVDDEGNPIYQQMDHQVLVPLLIAEIQQLRARVAALESA